MAAAWLKPLEALINRHIASSTRAGDLLEDLEGRVLGLIFTGTPLKLYLLAGPDGVALDSSCDRDPDAVLRGTPFALAALARGGEPAGRLEIEGDVEVARLFQALLQAARPDWEEELARLVGDTAAHTLGNAIRALGRWGRAAASSLGRDAAEYLQEEGRDLPARGEIEAFDSELGALRAMLERAESRLRRLEEDASRVVR
jgi:ubiquinone biosynthesis protein UbiJ